MTNFDHALALGLLGHILDYDLTSHGPSQTEVDPAHSLLECYCPFTYLLVSIAFYWLAWCFLLFIYSIRFCTQLLLQLGLQSLQVSWIISFWLLSQHFRILLKLLSWFMNVIFLWLPARCLPFSLSETVRLSPWWLALQPHVFCEEILQ